MVTTYLVCRKVEILLRPDDLPDFVEAESKCITWQCILADMHQRVRTCGHIVTWSQSELWQHKQKEKQCSNCDTYMSEHDEGCAGDHT